MNIFNLVVVKIALIYPIQILDVGVTLLLECGPVKWSCLFHRKAICLRLMYAFRESGSVPYDFLRHTSIQYLVKRSNAKEGLISSNPTLTHVPPNFLLSIAIVFAPCTPLALRAQARPPLPPPMTRKSHSFVTGAILVGKDEKCREKDESLVFAVFKAVLEIELTRRAIDLMRMCGNGGRFMQASEKGSLVWSRVTCYLTS
jgi:hypothetical protein